MLDLDTELKHLALAERHVSEGAPRLEQMRSFIEHGRSLGADVGHAERALAAMEDAMAALVEHRKLITNRVEAIRKGLI